MYARRSDVARNAGDIFDTTDYYRAALNQIPRSRLHVHARRCIRGIRVHNYLRMVVLESCVRHRPRSLAFRLSSKTVKFICMLRTRDNLAAFSRPRTEAEQREEQETFPKFVLQRVFFFFPSVVFVTTFMVLLPRAFPSLFYS